MDDLNAIHKEHVFRFTTRYCEDVAAGRVRSLDDYLAEFPRFPEVIRKAYAELAAHEPVASDESAGRMRVGHYEIIRELGRGGQGVVYLARDESLGRHVALKMLTGLAAHSQSMRARLAREAEATSKLDNAGLCAVYEIGEHDGAPFIAMRYVEGESLAQRIATAKAEGIAEGAPSSTSSVSSSSGGPASRGELIDAVHLVERIARVLHEAHEAGLVHRDIKPGNVMVTPAGEPVVLDFGLARTEESADQALTLSGETMGTPAYMAPEQITGQNQAIDRRTDVYALGVTLYELLTLQRPFRAPTRDRLFLEIVQQPAPDPRRLNPRVPTDLAVIVATALDKEQNRRFQTALDMAEDLARVRRYEPIHARPAGSALRIRRWVQRNPVVATLLTLLFLSLAGGLAWSLKERNAARRESARLERSLYRARIRDADGALQRQDFAACRAMLDACPPSLRDWSWRRLDSVVPKPLCVFTGHPDAIERLSFSPDGTHLVSGDQRGTLILWDVTSGRELHRIQGQRRINAIAHSPDGRLVAAGMRDVKLRVWDSTLMNVVAELDHLAQGPVAFSPSGRHLVALTDQRLVAWRTDTWQEAVDIRPRRGGKILRFPTGDRVTFGRKGVHDTVSLIDGRYVASRELPGLATSGVGMLSPSGRWLLARLGYENRVALIDYATGRLVQTLIGRERTHALGFVGDGHRLLTAGADKSLRLWDSQTGLQLAILGYHRLWIDVLTVGPAGDLVATGGRDGLVKLWSTKPPVGDLEIRAISARSVAFSPDGTTLATGGGDGVVTERDATTGELKRVVRTESNWAQPLYDAQGGLILIGGDRARGNLVRLSPQDGRVIARFQGHDRMVVDVALHPGGTRFASTSWDHTTRTWDLGGRELDRIASPHINYEVAYSPDGARLAVGRNGSVLLARAASGEAIAEFDDQAGQSTSVAFDRTGHLLAAGHQSGEIVVWDTRTKTVHARFRGRHAATVWSLCFSPDGVHLASGDGHGRILVWDVASGELLVSLKRGDEIVSDLVFSPDGQTLASICDGVLSLWESGARSDHRQERAVVRDATRLMEQRFATHHFMDDVIASIESDDGLSDVMRSMAIRLARVRGEDAIQMANAAKEMLTNAGRAEGLDRAEQLARRSVSLTKRKNVWALESLVNVLDRLGGQKDELAAVIRETLERLPRLGEASTEEQAMRERLRALLVRVDPARR